jgi:hypothetical protein
MSTARIRSISSSSTTRLQVQQRRVAALGGDVVADGLFRRIADQAVGAAGLGAGARQAFAAERLDADDRADDRAVDVDVAGRDQTRDLFGEGLDAAVDAEGQAVAALRPACRRRLLQVLDGS